MHRRPQRFIAVQIAVVIVTSFYVAFLGISFRSRLPMPMGLPPIERGYQSLYLRVLRGDDLCKSRDYEEALDVYGQAKRALHALAEYHGELDSLHTYRDAQLVIDNRLTIARAALELRTTPKNAPPNKGVNPSGGSGGF